MTPEGIEPPIFGSGIRRVTIAPWSHFFKKRSWSSGYDRRLPSDGPGFNSRRAQKFFLNFFSEPKKKPTSTRFELARAEPSRFRIYLLNHSDTLP